MHNVTRSKSHDITRTKNSTSTPRILLVTTVTASYEHWLRHLHRNLLLFGMGRLLRVCAADNATAALSARLHIEAVSPASLSMHRHHSKHPGGPAPTSSPLSASDFGLSVHSRPSSGKRPGVGETFMSSSWRAAVHFKQHCVWNLLERSAPEAAILLLDGDVTLFRDPLPLLLSLTSSSSATHARRLEQSSWSASGLVHHALHQFRSTLHPSLSKPTYDLAVMDDTTPSADKQYLNSGFMLLRNTPATRAFGRAYLAQLERRRTENDQAVFNDVLHRDARLRTLVLDSHVFMCGYFFYEYRHKRPLNASNVVAVHHNWIKGDRKCVNEILLPCSSPPYRVAASFALPCSSIRWASASERRARSIPILAASGSVPWRMIPL